MRRLSQQDDQGVTTLFIVVMMPVLLLFGALVFDGGRGIVARRQTQNAADAGALAKGTDCAKGIVTTDFASYQTNGAVLDNTPTCGSGTTTVSMKRNITFIFQPGGVNRDVKRSATATWGSLGGFTGTFPMTMSLCAYSLAAGGVPGTLPSQEVTMHANKVGACGSGPGDFGFLQNGCTSTVPVNANNTLPDTTGNNLQGTGCLEGDLVRYMTTDAFGYGVGNVLVPIWDSFSTVAPSGFHIAGFGLFHMTGYSLQGNKAGGTLAPKCIDGPGAVADTKECLRGSLLKLVTQQGSPGGSNFGTFQVYLSN
jgi:hypothetical protein